ncbi:pilus assembly protein PilZ [Candidatus Methylospira mobilis]|uniref:Pilus assembly protein PilZ n=1 Tax=Candidatus Methylospira mobilis TaxID=1808979 RepID=A0A5Q0BPE5_9GAMM|nr:PilZ domain-containing protein [Candidatus Methylospira mobilis]QFY43606.1 pilus assembly protein PilZ [Candidatus Methylospira mobilis]WNV04596.1 PilZ domain-containing protein [Candidatus Methylospira mobilis]
MTYNHVVPERKIDITIPDGKMLAQAWMPFVKNGGLFVPTQNEARLGEWLVLAVTLPDAAQPIRVLGHIVWLSRSGADNGMPAGWGIQFSERDNGQTRRRIEESLQRLAPSISDVTTTFTM